MRATANHYTHICNLQISTDYSLVPSTGTALIVNMCSTSPSTYVFQQQPKSRCSWDVELLPLISFGDSVVPTVASDDGDD